MTAVVEKMFPAHPVGKDLLQSTNIPFLERNPKAFLTTFQEDFQSVSSMKLDPVSHPTPAKVDHKDLRHNKEYLSEAMASYKRPPLPQITRTPCWTRLRTNIKMQTDPGENDFLTTTSQKFRPRPFQPPPNPIRPSLAIKKLQQLEKLPESILKSSYPPKQGSPLIKPTVIHLVEGFPTIKGDGRHRSFVSQYNNTFQGAWSRPVQPVEKHTSSVSIGDPEMIVERETTHVASFSRPPVCRPPVVKEHLKLNLGNFSEDPWSSTARETFRHHKLEEPVVLTKKNRNFSSVPKGDTDMGRNKERMSVTTNRNSFSNLDNKDLSVPVTGADLITKSHVQFSAPHLSDMYYTTTTTADYSKRDGERVKPATQVPSNIMKGPEHGVNLSVTGADFLPVTTCREAPFPSQQKGHIKFPSTHQYFITTHMEHYTAKPLISLRPSCSQLETHFVVQ